MNLDYVGIGSSLVLAILWFARLEQSTKHCISNVERIEKELDQLIIKHEALDSKVLDELSKVREALARIEGQLIGEKKIKERK